ncbi:RNA recognition motif domain [Cinara cedri]|uniref:RNA recognition motif domain n=2 Tax=Cinara cedri TaxID=506608 RepID=A0A5E4M533_9HEMI|nr:RNA recognition motif domain [Cinara cedri]
MNPLTNMRNVKKLSEQELLNLPKSSWHDEYKSSAWVFVGGLPYDLSEGDIMAIFSQYGEITNLNLVRDKDTGKPKGFCFICYEDQRSTVLVVDNFNGTRVLGRILRVDHVKDYKPPKSSEPRSKIKSEKLDDDDDFKIKAEIKQEVCTPEIKREICTPEIKHEICTPEFKREVCTPEIIRSPNYESITKKKKSKDINKKRRSRDRSQEKYTHNKHQREKSKEKDRKKHYKSERDKSSEKVKSNKRPRRSPSQENDIRKDSKTKLYKEYSCRDGSKEKCRKPVDDKEKDYNKKNKKKHFHKDDKYKK